MAKNDLSITFPTSHYVGRRKEDDGNILGFMTPDGSDLAASKRKETVDSWARRRSAYGWADLADEDRLEAIVLTNEPLEGFSLGKTVQHGYGWHKGDVKWRVADPRGFELEITAPNLVKLIEHFGISKGGGIPGACMWARLGAENILVPVDSDEYRNAIANTERKGKSASLKDLTPGDRVVMQNGTEGRFIGRFFRIEYDYIDGFRGDGLYTRRFKEKGRQYFFEVEDTDWHANPVLKIKGVTTPKLAEIIPGDPLSVDDALDIMFGHNHLVMTSSKAEWGFEHVSVPYCDVKAASESETGDVFTVQFADNLYMGRINKIDDDSHARRWPRSGDKIPDDHYRFHELWTPDFPNKTVRYAVIQAIRHYRLWASDSTQVSKIDFVPAADMTFGQLRIFVIDEKSSIKRHKTVTY